MTPDDHLTRDEQKRSTTTVNTMRRTAKALEEAEDSLHRSAEQAPVAGIADRLHGLGDVVTAEARDIARRAEDLSASAAPTGSPRRPEAPSGTRHRPARRNRAPATDPEASGAHPSGT
jgi:glycerate-2-kinase